jgi:excisionase family DNA binding protein
LIPEREASYPRLPAFTAPRLPIPRISRRFRLVRTVPFRRGMSHPKSAVEDCPAVSARTVLIDDAAAALNVSRRTVYYRIKDGKLQTVRTRCGSQRVLVSSIEALLRDGGDVAAAEAEAEESDA